MLIGLLLLLMPSVVFLVTLPISRKFEPKLCMLYRIVGGIIVIPGSALSYYLAAYTGDQGGIGAFYFQLTLIIIYVVFSVLLIILNLFLHKKASK
jgi:hypothetical protein